MDNTFAARSVREDTAELASYALSDRASTRSVSPPRQRQPSIDSYFAQGIENERSPSRHTGGLHHHTIEEVSEPVTPEESSSSSDRGPGTSILAKMLKHSPPETLHENGHDAAEGDSDPDGNSEEDGSRQGRLVLTSNGMESDPTERTSLLGRKSSRTEHHHPDWIRGDVEGQDVKRAPAWPKLRNAILWPQKKGVNAVRTVMNPKSWDRKAIVQHGVVEPVGYIPAVILGTLLNILDALSYGKSYPIPQWRFPGPLRGFPVSHRAFLGQN